MTVRGYFSALVYDMPYDANQDRIYGIVFPKGIPPSLFSRVLISSMKLLGTHGKVELPI